MFMRLINRASKKKSQLTEFQGKTEKSTAIVRNFTISLSIIDRSRQKINKHIEVLKNTINQLDLIEFHRTSYPKTAEYTSFQVYNYRLPKKTLFCAIKLEFKMIQVLQMYVF